MALLRCCNGYKSFSICLTDSFSRINKGLGVDALESFLYKNISRLRVDAPPVTLVQQISGWVDAMMMRIGAEELRSRVHKKKQRFGFVFSSL